MSVRVRESESLWESESAVGDIYIYIYIPMREREKKRVIPISKTKNASAYNYIISAYIYIISIHSDSTLILKSWGKKKLPDMQIRAAI